MNDGKLIQELLPLRPKELAREFQLGYPFDAEALVGWLYKGVSLGLPAWVDALAWKTFGKAFSRDEGDRAPIRGWNVRLRQTGLDGPVEPLQRRGAPIVFGHFHVVPMDAARLPRARVEGVLLDYGLGDNSPFDPTSRVRDPVVSMSKEGADQLLGWTYLDLGLFAMPTPSYFLLTRHERL